jgi:hypothetical protein
MAKSRWFMTLVSATVLALTLGVTGCHSSGPDGVYTDSTGHMSIEFKDGKAFLNLAGNADTQGTPFDVAGDKITIHYPSDGMLASFSSLTINSDGTLQSNMGVLTKK